MSDPEEWERVNRAFADQLLEYAERATPAEAGGFLLLPAELAIFGCHQLPHAGKRATPDQIECVRGVVRNVVVDILAYCGEIGLDVGRLLGDVEKAHRDGAEDRWTPPTAEEEGREP